MEDLKQICADVRADVVTTIGTLGVGHMGAVYPLWICWWCFTKNT